MEAFQLLSDFITPQILGIFTCCLHIDDQFRRFMRFRRDPAHDAERHAHEAAEDMCRLSCTQISSMEESLKDPNQKVLGHAARKVLVLNMASDDLQKAGDSLPYDGDVSGLAATFMVCCMRSRLAAAHMVQVKLCLASPGLSESSLRLRLCKGSGKDEEEAVKLLTRFCNDCLDMASAMGDVGSRKIEVLAQLAEFQELVPQAGWKLADPKFSCTLRKSANSVPFKVYVVDEDGKGRARPWRLLIPKVSAKKMIWDLGRKLSAMEESIKDLNMRSLLEAKCAKNIGDALDRLEMALRGLQEGRDLLDDSICDASASTICRISVRLATAFTEELSCLAASWDGLEAGFIEAIAAFKAFADCPLEVVFERSNMADTECKAVKLLTRFYNDRPDVALTLCKLGRQKIRVLAQLAEILTSIDEAPFKPDDFHVQRMMSRFWMTLSMAEVVEGLAQVVSNPDQPDLGVSNEACKVLMGIRNLMALPILAKGGPKHGADGWHTSLAKDLVLGSIGQHFEVHALFPVLGMEPTSEDLERFKNQAQLLGAAAMTSAFSPSVTVGEYKDGWLQRPQPECRSEVGGWQQVPAAGSWTLCSAAGSLQQASSAGSETLCSSSSSSTWDLVDCEYIDQT